MKLNHSQFQAKVTGIFESKGAWTFNVHGSRMQKRGVPDLLVIALKWKGFIEFKIGRDKCKPIQKSKIKILTEREFPTYVLRYLEDLDAIAIENEEGEELNLVVWEALWGWLKDPIIDPRSPVWKSSMDKIVGYDFGAGKNRRGRKEQ